MSEVIKVKIKPFQNGFVQISTRSFKDKVSKKVGSQEKRAH